MDKSHCPGEPPPPFESMDHYGLRNEIEECIRALVNDMMPEQDVCQCAKCRLDVIALALNHLPAHYVVTARGGLLAQVDQMLPQNQTDAVAAVMHAIMTVHSRPRHTPAASPDTET